MTSPPSKVLIIGSGPIVIGQAAEFDYSGSQACRSLREEGLRVVLVNSHPATIPTDVESAGGGPPDGGEKGGEPIPRSRAVTTVEDARAFVEDLGGLPVIVRAAYTL